MRNEWLKGVKIDELPDDFRALAESIIEEIQPLLKDKRLASEVGRLVTLVFMECFEGSEVYFPSMGGTVLQSPRRNAIRAEWGEMKRRGKLDPRRLAQKHNLTVRSLRDVVNDHEDQADLFTAE